MKTKIKISLDKPQVERDNEWLEDREYAEYNSTHIKAEEWNPDAPWATFPLEEDEEEESTAVKLVNEIRERYAREEKERAAATAAMFDRIRRKYEQEEKANED